MTTKVTDPRAAENARAVEAIKTPEFQAALQKARDVMGRPGCVVALDRLSVKVYDELALVITEDPDLAELAEAVDVPEAMALVIGWMLGHAGAGGHGPSDRQVATFRSVVLATYAAGFSAEINARSARRSVS